MRAGDASHRRRTRRHGRAHGRGCGRSRALAFGRFRQASRRSQSGGRGATSGRCPDLFEVSHAMPGNPSTEASSHEHVFLGEDHAQSERKTWAVIWLCGAMMCIEIVGGLVFGSIALVADGLHMSTHAGALLLAALAYTYARRHADNSSFTFGTGKFGDLAGYTSAIVLAMIAVLIGYESGTRILPPIQIHFAEAIPIACV